ncbi:MAG: glycoside hydrolase family 127 protein [Candidatus Pristimantibacillus lignocellulolyticus]|uniref:Glycoside hydrolase family 127 protein n=1 Tax=Candidatus Pristimantibacillus lignocellulolyticus TaxID=2994561 RepID=A0A9J6Z9E7_9BACL|nr:MAG: glycoside hydrolase family 127 protein [Candidatus Pristimantibacillus lignocellulolyticus]
MHTNKDSSHILPLKEVIIEDEFWSEYINLVREVVVPYQWEALNDRIPEAEPSYAVQNFKIAAGLEQGEFGGMVFQDSDVAKWLEAAGYLLQTKPDQELEKIADDMIDIIAKAQRPDGYLNTYFTLKEPNHRFTNLAECHELYCAGHMIEAAVAYYEATGKRKILDVVCKLADYIETVFGNEPGKLAGYDGHQEIELALVKLYRTTKNKKYLNLSQYFIDQRGAKPHFYDAEFKKHGGRIHFSNLAMAHDLSYSQAHLPVREQETAEGHAVRLVYMLAAMADLAAENHDEDLLAACRKLWNNIVHKRMYITGAIGSMEQGESFTADFDLPNDTAYAETCASIGLIFFAHRMLQLEADSKYADVLEKALYNTVVSGMARDGKSFFYVNPLEVEPNIYGKNHNYDHVKPVRQGWFGCACCPPNIARLLASLGQYIYTRKDQTIYTHLYIGGKAAIEFEGQKISIEQHSQYTWNGKVRFELSLERSVTFTLALRVPEWSGKATVSLNGKLLTERQLKQEKGYLLLERSWQTGDILELVFDMPIRRMKGHPSIRHTAAKTALQRGPFIYCLEEADNSSELYQLLLPRESELQASFDSGLLGGITVICADGKRLVPGDWQDEALYYDEKEVGWNEQITKLTFIPYFAWANRGQGEMTVWVKER